MLDIAPQEYTKMDRVTAGTIKTVRSTKTVESRTDKNLTVYRFATFSPQLPSPDRAFSHSLFANIKEISEVV